MRVYVDTTLTPLLKAYDTEEPGGAGIVKSILKPQIIATDDTGKPLFVYGQSPPDYTPYVLLGLLFFLLGGIKFFKR